MSWTRRADLVLRIQSEDLKPDTTGNKEGPKIGLYIDNDAYHDIARGQFIGKYHRHGVAHPGDYVVQKKLRNCFSTQKATSLKGLDKQPAVQLTYEVESNPEVATALKAAMVSDELLELWEVRKLHGIPTKLKLAGSAEDLRIMSYEKYEEKIEETLSPYLIEGNKRLNVEARLKTFLSTWDATEYATTLFPGYPEAYLDPDPKFTLFSTMGNLTGSPPGESESDVPGERSETAHLERDIMFLASMNQDDEVLDAVSLTRLSVRGTKVTYPTSIYKV
jgi:hypothetical protein